MCIGGLQAHRQRGTSLHEKGYQRSFPVRTSFSFGLTVRLLNEFNGSLVQLFLVAGHLVRFKVKGNSVFPAVKKKINLLDAYICSGYFAAQALPKGQYEPNAPPTAKRYGDGLETDDREEDVMFVIWYRSQPQMLNAEQDPTTTPVDSKTVPELSNRLKVLIFKTRSVLERDAWCWAINSEIEKIMRTQSQREMKLRDTGNLIRLGQ